MKLDRWRIDWGAGLAAKWVVCRIVLSLLMLGVCGCEHEGKRASDWPRTVQSVNAFGEGVAWKAPTSLKPTRMMVGPSVAEADVYAAVWDAEDEPRLVALSMSDASTFGDGIWGWDVEVLNKDGRIVRRGRVRCGYSRELPYCLLEIKTNNPKLPPSYRGRWTLAIGLQDVGGLMGFEVDQPFHFATDDADMRDRMNNLVVEPVEWAGEKFTSPAQEILDESPCICRPAEKVLKRFMHEGAVARE